MTTPLRSPGTKIVVNGCAPGELLRTIRAAVTL
jgi:hypothetical protein